ncbi:MFS transporter [Bacillaceae bacterium SIJ1]|nr:MFS transporter [Litoribacterium kuwaitense]
MLVLSNLFVFMSFQMLIPIMPPYIESLGASGTEIGLVTALFSIGAIVIRPFIGYLLSFQGRKHLVLIGSLSLLVMTVIYPLTNIVVFFLIARLLHGLAWGWSTTANGTAAVDITPNSRLGEGMGYFGLSVTIGMIVAPGLGILLYQMYDFNVNIIVSLVLGALAFIMLSTIKYQTPTAVKNTTKADVPFSFTGSLVEKASWYPAMITLSATFAYGTIATFIMIFAEERAIESMFLFYMVNAVIATCVRPITGRWFDKHGPKGLVIFCASFSFVAMWVLSITTSWVGVVIVGLLFGLGFGSLLPALQAWVLSKSTPERRGVANGMHMSCIDLGIGASSLVFGMIAKYVPTGSLFQMSSVFFLVVIFLTWRADKKDLPAQISPVQGRVSQSG